MALVLRSNPSRLSSRTGALFVSNPKKRKASKRKNARRNSTKKGMVRKTARRAYVKRKNSTKKGGVRKTARRAYMKRKNAAHKRKRVVRRNALAIKRRKNSTKKGMVRKTARRAYVKRKNALVVKRRNPAHKRKSSRRRVRMNPVRKMIRKNPIGKFVKGTIATTKKYISKVPLVGKAISNNIALSVGGMLGGLALIYSYKQFSKVLDQQSERMPDSFVITQLNNVNKYAGIALIGVVVRSVAKSQVGVDILGKEISDLIGMGAVVTGGALQAIKLYNLYSEKKGKEPISVDEKTASTAGLVLGDGGSYDVVPLSGVHHMGMMHKNARHLSGAHMSGLYMDSKSADAVMSGADLSAQEKRAAMSDESSYAQSFEQPPHRVTNTDMYSRHAGKHGHRWGWLIKMIGFDRFQKLAMLPPQKRVDLIAKMKKAAIASAQSTFDQAESSGYQGLHMDMSGLVVDNLSGLAVVGTAI